MKQLTVAPGRPLRGSVRVPGDKSVSHRALLFNAFARGRARVSGLLRAGDTESSARCLRQLGAIIDGDVITGVNGRFTEPSDLLDCGNSGTSMRLLAGLLAGQPFFSVLSGDASLRRRPMGRVAEPLTAMGARFDGREGGRLPPISVRGGQLRAIDYHSPVASAQVKTALVLATLQASGEMLFTEPSLSRDHTERMLGAMGVRMERIQHSGRPGLRVPGGQVPEAIDVEVPGDISSAAFFLVAAAIVPGSELLLRNVGINPTRAGVLEVLQQMGADIDVQNPRDAGGEPVADLLVRSGPLKAFSIGGDLIPRLIDEVPVLAVAAAFADGESVVRDAQELRVKESDRAACTVAALRAIGVEAEELPDGLVVRGGRAKGGEVQAHSDHRIAMAFAVAGCAAEGPVQVHDAENIATSFPEFISLLEHCRG